MQRSLNADMARFGSLARRSQLYDLGYSERDVRRAVDDHELWPIRRAWLAQPGADYSATRAVGLGGRLASESALASYGVWVTRPSGLWVAVPPSASRLPPAKGSEHRLWVPEHFPHRDDRQWRMSLRDSLAQYARVGSAVDVIASFDSALNSRLLKPAQLDEVIGVLPRRLRRLLKRVNALAASGLETLLRLAAEAEGWKVQIQVEVDRVGHVDVLIDGWLVIELDGGEWHDDAQAQEEDRRRDAELILLGYRWHRFRHSQVLGNMPLCLEVIRTILASGRPVAA
jgi:very-short-patch-repair endonuclease